MTQFDPNTIYRTKPAPLVCSQCRETLPDGATWRTILCERCLEAHKAQWRDEHTRKPGDMRSGWLIGDECRVTLRKVEYEARILDMRDLPDASYYWTQLSLTKTVKGLDGKFITQSWVHPEPVQSYKLRKPLLK